MSIYEAHWDELSPLEQAIVRQHLEQGQKPSQIARNGGCMYGR